MKVYLDDIRQHPEGWERAYTAPEAIKMLETGTVVEISLDHDLGEGDVGDGYDVIRWIEERVCTDSNFNVPEIHLHTANPVAHERMAAARAAIYRAKE